jgi:hypothetical protein
MTQAERDRLVALKKAKKKVISILRRPKGMWSVDLPRRRIGW